MSSIHLGEGRSMRALRTARWRSDEALKLVWPADWSVSVLRRACIRHSPRADHRGLRNPVGPGPLADLCRDTRRPLVTTDALSRPTATASILDPPLDDLKAAGIGPNQVSILAATGTHPPPSDENRQEDRPRPLRVLAAQATPTAKESQL